MTELRPAINIPRLPRWFVIRLPGGRISIDTEDVRATARELYGASGELHDVAASLGRASSRALPALNFSTIGITVRIASVRLAIDGLGHNYNHYAASLRREADHWERLDNGGWFPGFPWWPILFPIIGWPRPHWPWPDRIFLPWPPGRRPPSPVRIPPDIGIHPMPLPRAPNLNIGTIELPPSSDSPGNPTEYINNAEIRRWLGGYGPGMAYQYQCTAWANFRWKQLGYGGNPVSGNGGSMATSNGFPQSNDPSLGALVEHLDPGHVMIVEKIDLFDPRTITVSEGNGGQDGTGSLTGTAAEWGATKQFVEVAPGQWKIVGGGNKIYNLKFATFPK
ncbi:MAG: CHAP domain-containing protein [Acidimicrobiia bacterium]|nr:CHAP domain-containing protein [Acidimicrobiia bacterium]